MFQVVALDMKVDNHLGYKLPLHRPWSPEAEADYMTHNPAGKQRWNNVDSMLIQRQDIESTLKRQDVESTLNRRCFNTVCPPGNLPFCFLIWRF